MGFGQEKVLKQIEIGTGGGVRRDELAVDHCGRRQSDGVFHLWILVNAIEPDYTGIIFGLAKIHEVLKWMADSGEEASMGKLWTVVKRTGSRMDLECGFERREVQRPTDPMAKKIFMEIQPGRSVDEGTLRLLLGKK